MDSDLQARILIIPGSPVSAGLLRPPVEQTMFDEARYRDYLYHFNKPDHDTLHREFFAPDVELVTLGNVLCGQEGIRKFYAYFHSCVREHIDLIKFYPTDGGAWVHVAMRLEAFEDLTEEGLAGVGIQRMPAILRGAVYENEMFIHYQLNPEGKLRLLRCAEYIPPINVIE